MKIIVGKYVNTHGIKGEIRIKSNFKYKDKVFLVGNKLYLKDKEFLINSYRVHKGYDMVTFKGINDINLVLPYKGLYVYFEKKDLNLTNDEYLDSDLIGLNIYINNKIYDKVSEIRYINNNKKLLVVNKKLIPFELIKKIDFDKKIIILKEVDGLL